MNSESYKETELKKIAVFKNGKTSPERNNSFNFPVYGSNGIIGYSEEFNAEYNSTIIGRVGSYCGSVYFSKNKSWVTDNAIIGTVKNGNDPKYFYYLLKLLNLNSLSVGSGQPLLNQKILYSIEAPIPPIEVQRKIGQILSYLDQKIELNNQMNQTLEQIGQAIFKHWFADFEFPDENGHPYKSNGGEMVDSELLEIPKGWEIGNLGKLISITSGKRPKKKYENKTNEFEIPLIGASSIMGYVKETLYNEPVLVIGRVGTHGIVQKIMPPSYPSDNTLVIKSRFYEFIYQVLRIIDYDSLNVGTTQPLITQKSIKNLEIIIPSNKVLEMFEKVSHILFLKIQHNTSENEHLANIRDSILPKLMSGKISVNIPEEVSAK